MAALALLPGTARAAAISFQNRYVRLVVEHDGTVSGVFERSSAQNHALASPPSPLANIRKDGRTLQASSARRTADGLSLGFGDSGITAELTVSVRHTYITFEVTQISDEKIQEFTFLDIPLVPQANGSAFSWAALQMTLHTKVTALPGMGDRLQAVCYPEFGVAGAKVGIIGSPSGKMRSIMKRVVYAAKDDVPYNPYGGPWAMDHEFNRGSYIVDCTQMRDATVDQWIRICADTGIRQIDFSNWNFLNGEYEVNLEFIPGGKEELRRVIERLHHAGIRCGLHTYSFLIDRKSQRYLGPRPDPRLLKGARLTSAGELDETSTTLTVEPGPGVEALGAGAVVQIGHELVTVGSVNQTPPCALTECTRGILGTKPEAHGTGSPIAELRQAFGVFVPDVRTTLYREIAGNIASLCNECGFDMMYLDAVDSYSVLDGAENGWYWATLFVNEIMKRVEKPVMLEGSTLWHGLWFARSRIAAWDVPIRAEKECYDAHFVDNLYYEKTYLPTHLGWCDVRKWNPVWPERTFVDDIEFLLCKGMAADCGISMQSYLNPANYMESENAQRIGKLIGAYERLRAAKYFPESIRQKLAISGSDYTLEKDGKKWFFRPVSYAKHKVNGNDPGTCRWTVENQFSPQPVGIRIEALMSMGPYDSPEGKVLTDYTHGSFDKPEQVQGVASSSFTVGTFPELGRAEPLACFKALANSEPAWAMYKTVPTYTLDCALRGFGVWVHGDGLGEILNLQNSSAPSYSTGYSDNYLRVDFEGWRYVDFVEPETTEISKYEWPLVSKKCDWAYTDKGPSTVKVRVPPSATAYSMYIMYGAVNMVNSCGIWYNNLPVGKEVTTYLSPIRALPLIGAKVQDPSIEVNGVTIVFPGTLESGQYIEYRSMDDCVVYNAEGSMIAKISPTGEAPTAQSGSNKITFRCVPAPEIRPRLHITVVTKGERL